MCKSTGTHSPESLQLETDRLILRPWRGPDREPFAAMSSDSDVMAYLLPFASPEAVD